jgi:hypothetical protein
MTPDSQNVNTGHASYPFIPILRKTGEEHFTLGEKTLPMNLHDFWQWSASDLIGNTTRGCLAEYIVSMALELTTGVRNDWDAYDLQFDGWNIEVKASAFLQSWFQKRLSRPSFSIRPARRWDPRINELVGEPKRHAHLYICCLLDHKEKATLNPLNLDQWRFYILKTADLDAHKQHRTAKTIGLPGLLLLKPHEARFADLKRCVAQVTEQLKTIASSPSLLSG